MLALGGLLICGALLALAVSALIFRSPNPPGWTTRSWASELIAVVIVSMLGLGVADTIAAAVRAYREGPDLVDLGLLAAVLLVSVVIWRRLDVRSRLRAMAAPDAEPAGPQRAGQTSSAEPPPSRPAARPA